MATITVIATTRDDAASQDLKRNETHFLLLATNDTSPIVVAHIGVKQFATTDRTDNTIESEQIRAYATAIDFLKDWTDIKTTI